jgi:hypothetical protein
MVLKSTPHPPPPHKHLYMSKKVLKSKLPPTNTYTSHLKRSPVSQVFPWIFDKLIELAMCLTVFLPKENDCVCCFPKC